MDKNGEDEYGPTGAEAKKKKEVHLVRRIYQATLQILPQS